MSDNLVVLEIGLGCCCGTKENCTISYRDPCIDRYYYHLQEGGFVIDKSRPLETDPVISYLQPMCSPRLVGDEVNPMTIGADSIVLNALSKQDGGYGPLARAALAEAGRTSQEPGSLDYVSPAAYANWWHGKGARVGQRIGNNIEWRDGVRTKIAVPDF